MKKLLTLLFIASICCGCCLFSGCAGTGFDTHATATRVLAMRGYKNIQLNGRAFFRCRSEDYLKQNFTAELNNRQIKGLVCCRHVISPECIVEMMP